MCPRPLRLLETAIRDFRDRWESPVGKPTELTKSLRKWMAVRRRVHTAGQISDRGVFAAEDWRAPITWPTLHGPIVRHTWHASFDRRHDGAVQTNSLAMTKSCNKPTIGVHEQAAHLDFTIRISRRGYEGIPLCPSASFSLIPFPASTPSKSLIRSEIRPKSGSYRPNSNLGRDPIGYRTCTDRSLCLFLAS